MTWARAVVKVGWDVRVEMRSFVKIHAMSILTTLVLYSVYSKILRHLAAQFFQEKSLSRC